MVFETLLNLIFRDWNGNIALGILIIANVPKPIVNKLIGKSLPKMMEVYKKRALQ